MNGPRGKLVSYGVFDIDRGRKDVDQSRQSFQVHEPITIFGKSSQIPLKKGIRFGIKYAITGLPRSAYVSIAKVVTHPRLTTPDGNTLTRQKWMFRTKSNDGGQVWGCKATSLLTTGSWFRASGQSSFGTRERK